MRLKVCVVDRLRLSLRGEACAQPWRGHTHSFDRQKVSALKYHNKITDHGNTIELLQAYKPNNDLRVV